jgi:CRP-like cAMP-binding protein
MKDILRNHILRKIGDDTSQLEAVLSEFQHIAIKCDTQLLRQGDVCKHVYFVATGCLQVSNLDQNHKETTRDFVIENYWCSELVSFSKQVPAIESITAIEDSNLLAISRSNFYKLMSSVPQFEKFYTQLLEASYAHSVHKINALMALSATEKIEWLTKNQPHLLDRVSSKMIASYLGITQETYSRLKRK